MKQLTTRYYLLLLLLAIAGLTHAQNGIMLPVWDSRTDEQQPAPDWLVTRVNTPASIYRSQDGRDIILYNGLLRRDFRLSPNLACIGYIDLSNGRQQVRTVREEARLTINGKEYRVGGLYPPGERGYLTAGLLADSRPGVADFQFERFETGPIVPQLNWKNNWWATPSRYGTGIRISFVFRPGTGGPQGIVVRVNYELYDGMPLLVKSLTVTNTGGMVFTIGRAVNEVLAMVEEESTVAGDPLKMRKPAGHIF